MSILSSECCNNRQRALLNHFGTTHEACLLVFVLAGAADSQGRTMHEILQGTSNLTGGHYDEPAHFQQLHLARFYLSHTGHLKCVPRVNPMSGCSANAFTHVPFGSEPAWRRSELAEEKAQEKAKAILRKRFPSRTKQGGFFRSALPGRGFLKRLTSLLR